MSSQPSSPLSSRRRSFGSVALPSPQLSSDTLDRSCQGVSSVMSESDDAGSDDSTSLSGETDRAHLTGRAGASSSLRLPSSSSHGWRRPATPSSPTSPIVEQSAAVFRAVSRQIRRVADLNKSGAADEVSLGQPRRLLDADDSDSDASVRLRTAGLAPPLLRDLPLNPSLKSGGAQALSSAAPADSRALVGNSLGVFSPENRFRKACWAVLHHPATDPVLLLLVLANVVLIIVQAERPIGTRAEAPYFRRWEDYCLVVLFVIFTLEAAVRIVVSGLLLDPHTATAIAAADVVEAVDGTIADGSAVSSARASTDSKGSDSPKRDPKVAFRRAVFSLRAVLALTGTASENARRRELEGNGSIDSSDDDDSLSITPLVPDSTAPNPPMPSKLCDRRRRRGVKSVPPSFIASKLASTLPVSLIAYPVPSPAESLPATHAPSRLERLVRILRMVELPFQRSLLHERQIQLLGRPYLRHSWNRVDAVAILCFWTMLSLALTESETQNGLHLFIFRSLSILRASRLLLVTSGTVTILHSLKRAAHLLANALVLFLFALALFSIIGVQAFSGSYRRSCHLVDPANVTNLTDLGRSCGSWYDSASGSILGAVSLADPLGGAVGRVKGFTCPPQQICAVADENLVTGQTFDNVLGSALQVFIISSANGWSPIMFDMMDSDYFAASIFFVLGLVILNFWLSQLGIAIIVSSFHDVRAETRRSAFGGKLSLAAAAPAQAAASIARPWKLSMVYERTRFFWVALAVASLATQATLCAGSSDAHLQLTARLNLVFACAFAVEMVIRFFAAVPDRRAFFHQRRNWLDLILAVVSLVIEIPVIRSSEAYGWLAIFPLARWYRVILVVPRMKPLLLAVFGQVGGLLNMTAFLGLNTLLGAILAIQLFQDDIEEDGETLITFHSLYNALLGMFQVMTSENWTDPLQNAMDAEWPFRQGVLSALFLCSWFLFSNFVMLQMFVACVSENFSVAADSAKRERQLEFHLGAAGAAPRRTSWLDKLEPKRLFSTASATSSAAKLPPSLVLPSKPAVVRDEADPRSQGRPSHFGLLVSPVEEGMVDYLWRVLRRKSAAEQSFALDDLAPPAGLHFSRTATVDQQNAKANQRERERTMRFITRYPSWDRSLFFVRQTNPLRRLCQRLVPCPAGGVRSFGRPASPAATFALKACVGLTVLASVVTAAVATPAYRRDRYDPDADSIAEWPWYDVVDCVIALLFTIELLIKIVADGLFVGPSPYLRSPWNALDGVVYVGILLNTITTVTSVGGLNVFTRALKAVRCLRLISLSSRLRATLTAVLQGASKIVDASVLVVLYMIPYAVWGVTLFRGLLFSCNNDADRADCIGEFLATPIDGVGSGFPLPQVWANPTDGGAYAFDDFRQSLLILFEIISLEGWTSAMGSLMAITTKGQQPRINASSGNALFLVFYTLFGAVLILTLFVAIILAGFSARSGAALLTTEQRHWVDLRRTIWQQRPSRQPTERPTGFRSWCFDRAVSKGGWWNTSIGLVYLVHCVTLLSQTYDNSAPGGQGNTVRDCLFLGFCTVFAGDLLMRYLGLGWHVFRADKWSTFRAVMIAGASTTTAVSLASALLSTSVVGQLQKIFLVGLCLNIVKRSSRLSQLLRTALASLPAISSLFLLWLVLFAFYAILFLEAFGLTKHNTQENRYISFRDFATTLVMLAVFTNGEGWNGYMHDYTLSWPRCTKGDNLYLRSDCGSAPAAYAMFISWNVLSMYLFVNVVTACVVENFSYVFYLPGKTSLSREQLRAYKRAWAETDLDRTGRISRYQVGTLLYKLSGVLEVKPYPADLSVRNLVALASASPSAASVVEGARACVDTRKLAEVLSRFDFDLVKQRRQRFERLYREAGLPDGISFPGMLELLAHHVLVDDELALLLEELIRRRERTDHIRRLIDITKVESFLLATVYRRRRRRHLALYPQLGGRPSIGLVLAQPPPPAA